MLRKFFVFLKTLPSSNLHSFHHQLTFSATPHGSNHPSHILNPRIYTHLLQTCLQKCKQVKTHNLFDEIPQRLSQFSTTNKIIHAQSLKLGFWSKGGLGNVIVDLYAKCADVDYAERAFKQLEYKDILAWNSILSMHSKQGFPHMVVKYFGLLLNSGVWPNEFTFAIVLSSCARLDMVECGRQIHCNVVKMGFESISYCEGALIGMYAKCNLLTDARSIFDGAVELDKVSWTSMIGGYIKVGLPEEAVKVFQEMEKAGQEPDQVAFVTVINAYVDLGRLDNASDLFSRMPNRNVVAWNLMISGHAKGGYGLEAIYEEDCIGFLTAKLMQNLTKCFSTEHFYSARAHREAYATILHSANFYVCGAIAAAQSIRMAGSTRDLVILVDETITDYHREGLAAAGWKIHTIQRIRNPKAERDSYNEWNYSKFRLWQLTDYDKIIFIDADMLILRNIDFLFEMPEISATGNNATLFNSGVMVVEPSNCTFQLLMDHINEIESYNGGDQGYLNEIFTWWHRIPKHMNFLKHFWEGDEEEKKQMKTRLFGADPPILYVLHYLGNKPWICFRDYDCNWNVDILQEFASDVAHKTWWKVHDAMPENLHKYCLLRSKQKAALEWDRRQAEKANYTDGHWKIKIKDKRLETCYENFCFWESMLWHWGDKNWTENATVTPSPPAVTATSVSL